MTLPFDLARCHDGACQQRRRCLRWLERDTGGPGTPHVATLRIFSGTCQGFMPPEPDHQATATP